MIKSHADKDKSFVSRQKSIKNSAVKSKGIDGDSGMIDDSESNFKSWCAHP